MGNPLELLSRGIWRRSLVWARRGQAGWTIPPCLLLSYTHSLLLPLGTASHTLFLLPISSLLHPCWERSSKINYRGKPQGLLTNIQPLATEHWQASRNEESSSSLSCECEHSLVCFRMYRSRCGRVGLRLSLACWLTVTLLIPLSRMTFSSDESHKIPVILFGGIFIFWYGRWIPNERALLEAFPSKSHMVSF